MTGYNAKDCVVTFGDVYITGFGDGMISGEKDEENFSTSVGAQGDVLVNEINNPLGTVTMTLQATSPVRSYLDDCARAGRILPLWAVNKSLNERMGGTQARVTKPADREYGSEADDIEYTFKVFDYTCS